MKIIVFVGSPIQDGEKDVSERHTSIVSHHTLMADCTLYMCVHIDG